MTERNVKCLSDYEKNCIHKSWLNDNVTKTYLADQFDVSTRTIGRVIDSFEDTPCKILGYSVGDKFQYDSLAPVDDLTFELEETLVLTEDDGSECPKFEDEEGRGGYEMLDYVNLVGEEVEVEVIEDNPKLNCEALGYKEGDLFKYKEETEVHDMTFEPDSIFKLTRDDGSILPFFVEEGDLEEEEHCEYLQFITPCAEVLEEPVICEGAVYQFGDFVEVTNTGHVYSSYATLANKLNLTGFKSCESPKEGQEYSVIAAIPHLDTGLIVYAIEAPSGEQYLISGQGLAPHKEEPKGMYTLIPGSIIVIQYEGDVYTVDASHGSFDAIVNYCSQGWYDSAVNLAQPIKAITEFTKGDVTVANGHVMYMGDEVNDGLAMAILRLMEEGDEGFKKLVAFLGKVKKNPSYKSRMELFGFIKAADIEITDSGDLICWKAIREEWTDCYTGKIDNSIGTVVTMDRTEVNDDSSQTCSAGLHCCAKSYLGSFHTARVVKVLVNPEDVVSIPTDYNDAKMRTCKYVVIEEVTDL